ncbi:hypothetical protein MXB_4669 [Myxobolus squamalis]|nr:hypothetical protein MXB_4669 [Myxobolus squamalis]
MGNINERESFEHACVDTMASTGRRGSYGGFKNNRGNSGFNRQRYSEGPPEEVTEVGKYIHSCEGDIVVHASINKIPYFNASIFLENKVAIGKVDEIFGAINDYVFILKFNKSGSR